MSRARMARALLQTTGLAAVLAGASLLAAAPSQAQALAPGGTLTAPFTAASVPPAGNLVAATSSSFTTPGGESGTVRSAVYNNGRTLDFFYQVSVSSSVDGLNRFTAFNFAGFTTSILDTATAFGSFVAGTHEPNSADRSPGGGGTVGFNFTG